MPIYWGHRKTAEQLLPAPHSVIFVDDFQGPKALADYLTHLITHPDEYFRYLEWKERGFVDPRVKLHRSLDWRSYLCRLCDKYRS